MTIESFIWKDIIFQRSLILKSDKVRPNMGYNRTLPDYCQWLFKTRHEEHRESILQLILQTGAIGKGGENIVPTRHEKIMVLKGVECDLALLNGKIDELVDLAQEQLGDKIKSKLKEIVPEYKTMG